MRGLHEEDDGLALRVHRLPADRVWYLVLVQAYLEQGRAKGDRAWCHGVVVTKGCKAGMDNKWAVYRGVKEIGGDAQLRTYDMGPHTVYCHYPKEVVRIRKAPDGRVAVFLDGRGLGGQPPKAGAAAVQVKGMGQETEVIVSKVVYGAESDGEVQTVADVVGGLGEEVTDVWMVLDAKADMASLRKLNTKPLHEALATGLACQVYTIWHRLETRCLLLVIHLVRQELH